MNYGKQHLKTNMYNVSWSTSYKVDLKAKYNYYKKSEYTGHSKMAWQLSMGQSSNQDV